MLNVYKVLFWVFGLLVAILTVVTLYLIVCIIIDYIKERKNEK